MKNEKLNKKKKSKNSFLKQNLILKINIGSMFKKNFRSFLKITKSSFVKSGFSILKLRISLRERTREREREKNENKKNQNNKKENQNKKKMKKSEKSKT